MTPQQLLDHVQAMIQNDASWAYALQTSTIPFSSNTLTASYYIKDGANSSFVFNMEAKIIEGESEAVEIVFPNRVFLEPDDILVLTSRLIAARNLANRIAKFIQYPPAVVAPPQVSQEASNG